MLLSSSLLFVSLAAAAGWPNAPGFAELLGVAPGGDSWAVRLVLPASDLSHSETSCGYPAIGGEEPAAVTLALCTREGCQSWPVYELYPCTEHDAAVGQLELAKAAWATAGVPWTEPVEPLPRVDGGWQLPEGALRVHGLAGSPVLRERIHSLPDESLEQRLELSVGEDVVESQVLTTYPPQTGAMGMVAMGRLFLLRESGLLFGFLGGGHGGGEYTATDPVVVELKAIGEVGGG